MRVFLFISKYGHSLPIAQRVLDEGHRVIFYINSPGHRRIGEGLVEKSPVRDMIISGGRIDESIIRYLLYPKPDCIVFDMAGEGFGKLSSILEGMGYPVVGLSQWGNQLEMDKEYSGRILGMQGIYPLKESLEGIEVTTELWYNGTDVLSVNHSMKDRNLMEGGLGPEAGCMGNVLWIGDCESRLVKSGVGKLIPILERLGYRGCISLTTLVTKDKIYVVDVIARFNYDSIYSLLELYGGNVNDFLYGLASGVMKELRFKDGWGVGVTFVLEPYPLPISHDYSKDTIIRGINKNNERHIWFRDVYQPHSDYMCAGNGGNLGMITARSLNGHSKDEHTVREAKRRAYRTLANLVIRDVMYRKDIGSHVERNHRQLKTWGWI